MVMTVVNPISTSRAAESLGISPRRVLQLCAEHSIGSMLNPRARVLDQSDVEKLREILAAQTHQGWPRGVARKKT
jgi:hypothetical protein